MAEGKAYNQEARAKTRQLNARKSECEVFYRTRNRILAFGVNFLSMPILFCIAFLGRAKYKRDQQTLTLNFQSAVQAAKLLRTFF